MTEHGASWWREWRTVDAVTIFHVDLAPRPVLEAEAGGWLDADERARRDAFRAEHARRAFVLCRAALRQLLCDRLACANAALSFGAHARGKPYAIVGATAHPVPFNVGHSGAHGLIAIGSADPVGIDLEERSFHRDLEGVAGIVFTVSEQAELSALEGDEKVRLFYRLWTMKEALMKGTGEGFSLDPASFAIPQEALSGPMGTVRLPTGDNRDWTVMDLGADAFAAALAFPA